MKRSLSPVTGAEDFSFMLRKRPGAYIFVGNGVDANGKYAPVHTPLYDFNDEALPFGVQVLGRAGAKGTGGLARGIGGFVHQKLPVSVARAATWCTCVLITLDAMALFGATHTAIAIGPLAAASLLIAIPAGLHIVYTRWRPDPFVGPISGGLAAICWAGLGVRGLRPGGPALRCTAD